MNVAIIGDGGWGTALGLTLLGNGHRVIGWGPFPDYVERLRRERENALYLPGVTLPPELVWTADREEALDGAEIVVLAAPTPFFRSVTESLAGLVPASATVVSVAKGIEKDSFRRMTEVAEAVLGRGPVAALSGPSHASEVARGIPTAVVAACRDEAVAQQVQSVFMGRRFRVYTTDDVAGVELGGALKNVIAIAAGVSDGIGFGHNTKAALVTRGLVEISRLGVALGARASTFAGLSGMGDLVVTCTSPLSRNRAVGERLGRGEKLEDILAGMKQVAEGVWNCRVARELAGRAGVDVPITDEVYAVLYEGKSPIEAVEALMMRAAKPEADGSGN
jgi:glycerol-3-phosphate dehydrogenase (NAD(P)+)